MARLRRNPTPVHVNEISNTPASASPETATESPLICLHIGCGGKNPATLHEAFRGPEWQEIRLDIDPEVEPDIVASIADLSPIRTASVDSVWSSHNLEHLAPQDVPKALAEIHRVLRPGGLFLVTLPDLQVVAQLVAEDKLEEAAYQSPAGPITPLDILYGHRPSLAAGKSAMAHQTGFTPTTLRKHLANAGFTEGKIWTQGFDLWALMTR